MTLHLSGIRHSYDGEREVLRGIDIDMADISDTVQTLAVVAAFADGATRVRGRASLVAYPRGVPSRP